jgi:hypothetical protein
MTNKILIDKALFANLIAQHPGLAEELAEMAAPQPAQCYKHDEPKQGCAWCNKQQAAQPFEPMAAEIDVRKILIEITPGDGDGYEVYAESNSDVVKKLTEMSQRLEEWELGIRRLAAPQSAQPAELAALNAMVRRRVFDAIRGAYDLGYNDARNARTVPGDSAPGYTGRDVEVDHGEALLSALQRYIVPQAIQHSESAACECHRCIKEKDLCVNSIPLGSIKMILCPTCGNKRCPHASDHRLACTGSNESGQPGSVYTAPPAESSPL